jgi:hypothetical protein
MTTDMPGGASSPDPKAVPTRQTAEDQVQEASEESFPASDSPSWIAGHEGEPASSSPASPDASKDGCAVSFIMEERGELDKLCERTPAEQSQSYSEPDKVKEAGGEG